MDAFRRIFRTLPLLLAIALVGACSSSGPVGDRAGDPPAVDEAVEPLARVITASDQALDAGSMHMEFSLSMRGGGEELSGSGEADAAFGDEPRMRMTFRYDEMPGIPDGFGMEMLVDGSVMFMRVDGIDEPAPFPTEWVSVDMAATVPGFDELTTFGGGSNDPTNAFGYLQGAEDARELGTETIGGVETTHYEATVDLVDALDEAPAELRDEMRRAVDQFRDGMGITTVPFELWIDGDGLARRIVYRMRADGALGKVSIDMTTDITEYGNTFELDVPPPSEVTDLTELASQGGDWS